MLGAVMQLLAVINTLLLLLLCWWSQYDAPVVNHAPLRLEQGLHPLPPNAIQSLIVELGEATDKAERAASAASTSAAISSATTRSAATGNSHTPRLPTMSHTPFCPGLTGWCLSHTPILPTTCHTPCNPCLTGWHFIDFTSSVRRLCVPDAHTLLRLNVARGAPRHLAVASIASRLARCDGRSAQRLVGASEPP